MFLFPKFKFYTDGNTSNKNPFSTQTNILKIIFYSSHSSFLSTKWYFFFFCIGVFLRCLAPVRITE